MFIREEVFSAREGARMGESLTYKLIRTHLAEGKMHPHEEIALAMDQALLQDATGTLAWLEFEQMGVARVRVQRAKQYVDHKILHTRFGGAGRSRRWARSWPRRAPSSPATRSRSGSSAGSSARRTSTSWRQTPGRSTTNASRWTCRRWSR